MWLQQHFFNYQQSYIEQQNPFSNLNLNALFMIVQNLNIEILSTFYFDTATLDLLPITVLKSHSFHFNFDNFIQDFNYIPN